MIKKILSRFNFFAEKNATVLMYHRIGSAVYDPWGLCVSAKNFETHLIALKSKYNVVRVDSLLQQIGNGKLKKDCVCLTFDDAYMDNFLAAKPLLEKYEIPATIFVASKFINRNESFWWDSLCTLILGMKNLPLHFEMSTSKGIFRYTLEKTGITDLEDELHKKWFYTETPSTSRCDFYLKLSSALRPLPFAEITTLTKFVYDWCGASGSYLSNDWPMTKQQLQELADHPLISIGIHTATHAALSFHDLKTQQSEIAQCKQFLQENCKSFLNIIAYPYGNYNETTIEAARMENLAGAFTTQHKALTHKSNLFTLGRFQVNDFDGSELVKRLL